ncbi:MAG: glycosyltransferase family 2 protein [Thermomicrobia bacterium]|nr:glycosyltransferase family 2 protein [Thermomicrobia bacterium]
MTVSRVPRFSIIIPLFNRVLFTTICIRALMAVADQWDEIEVILVDNGSNDGTVAFLTTLGAPFRVISNERNLGFAHACNQGATAAHGRYCIFLNNDTVPQPGWLTALAGAMIGPEAPAVVGARLLFPDETVQHAGLGFNARHEPLHLFYGEPADGAARVSRAVPAVTGACLMVERARFLAAGGFDEEYVNGFEDLDFCCRMRAAGGIVWYEAGSLLYHFESASDGRYRSDVANYDRFQSRWANWLKNDSLAHEAAITTEVPARLMRRYATGADMRRELERVVTDATAYRAEFERLRGAYDHLVGESARQEEWVRSLEHDAARVRHRNPLQRLVGKLLHM